MTKHFAVIFKNEVIAFLKEDPKIKWEKSEKIWQGDELCQQERCRRKNKHHRNEGEIGRSVKN